MTNRRAVREQLLKQAEWRKLESGPDKWLGPRNLGKESCIAFTCKSCWRRSLQSDLDDLRCPFCGSAMYEGSKP